MSLGLDPRFGIVEGFRDPATMAFTGAGWDRVVLSWADIQPGGPDDFSWLGRTVPSQSLDEELRRGVRVAGVLQFTPTWAAEHPDDGARSPPNNLYLADDDPNNYWGQFVYETAKFYAGRIDEWIIWNEPEFRPADPGAGGAYTWLGTDAEFAQLMRVGYRAAKRANPQAIVSFPATSYWDEEQSRPRREQFYERYLRLMADDKEAIAHGFYHDAVPLNLYLATDDIARVGQIFEDIQNRYGIRRPLWLTELNAMPTDDAAVPCATQRPMSSVNTTMEQQAAYAIQAMAMGAALDYARIGFYKMVDGDTCSQPALWGVVRDDGTRRPVAEALRVAIQTFSGFSDAWFVPLVRETEAWTPWPKDRQSYFPNWQVYQVIMSMPGDGRVTVLWSGDGVPLRVRVPRLGTTAQLFDRNGAELSLRQNGSDWEVDLPPATAHYPQDPSGYFYIGGDPMLLVETGVDPTAPAEPPELL